MSRRRRFGNSIDSSEGSELSVIAERRNLPSCCVPHHSTLLNQFVVSCIALQYFVSNVYSVSKFSETDEHGLQDPCAELPLSYASLSSSQKATDAVLSFPLPRLPES